MDNLLMRDRVTSIVNVVMRVPPLFIIDELLRIGMKVPEEPMDLTSTLDHNYDIANGKDSIFGTAGAGSFFMQLFNVHSYFLPTYVTTTIIIKFLACCFGILMSLCTFMLWTGHLMIVYMYLISVGTIFLSYWANVTTMKAIIAYYTTSHDTSSCILEDILSLNFTPLINQGPGLIIAQNYILQSILAFFFCYIHMAPRHPVVQKLLLISFLAPSIIGIHPLPTSVLHHAPVFAALLPLLLCKFTIWYNSISILKVIYTSYKHAHNFISSYGLTALAEMEWTRLDVPNVLRTFWIVRVIEQLIQIVSSNYNNDDEMNVYAITKTLLVNGCETLTALLGMTSIISSICHYVGCFFRWVLLTGGDEEKSIGSVSAILFYILALQTGLTSLDREKRLDRLLKNCSLLSTALLHFVHNIVNPILMSLSASHNPAWRRHLRALLVCSFLIIIPAILIVFLWSQFEMSTWLLAVTIFSIEVMVKVLVSLAVYSLFLFDAYRSTFWEPLDDCLYVIRSFGNTVEFTFGVILLFNGFWILAFESGGAIRAVMMGIHAYFNIWHEARAGWSVFMKRRTAVHKINILPEASSEQLQQLDDVCAICYQEMRSAKVTRCNHYFHGVCLRKWLYVQDRCPLCHDILYKIERKEDNKLESDGNDEDEDNVGGGIGNLGLQNDSESSQSIILPNKSGISCSNYNNNDDDDDENSVGVIESGSSSGNFSRDNYVSGDSDFDDDDDDYGER